METPGQRFLPLLRQSSYQEKSTRITTTTTTTTTISRLLKRFPILSSGCKRMIHLRRPCTTTTVTIFGHRKGRANLAIQEDPNSPPTFLVELPIPNVSLHKEMAHGSVKLALECLESSTPRKKLVEEHVWAVYCNGRKAGYSFRKRESVAIADNGGWNVLSNLMGVSAGAGVMGVDEEGETSYMRARVERVVGSKDSEALYTINPDNNGGAPELSIFLVRSS